MHNLENCLTEVTQQLHQAALAAGRNPHHITLVAVSKTQPASAIVQAHGAGLIHFGENYLQEAQSKMASLQHLPLVWHFLGPLQSNKAAAVARAFHWVHSVDSLKIAQKLSAARPPSLAPLNLCLQVNIDHQATKSGCPPQQACALALAIAALPNVRLRGLMAIPNPQQPAPAFAALRLLMAEINTHISPALDTLSMGMSADFACAIAEGSTLVRIGTRLFGARTPTHP